MNKIEEPLSEKMQDCNEIQALDYEGEEVEFLEVKDVKQAVERLKKELCIKMKIYKGWENEEKIDKIFGEFK